MFIVKIKLSIKYTVIASFLIFDPTKKKRKYI